jgi:glutaredoxin
MIGAVRPPRLLIACSLLWLAVPTWLACGNPVDDATAQLGAETDTKAQGGSLGERITPPFAVKGELEGLLLVWFDAQGVHTAQKRSEIPAASRALVRVGSLRAAPDPRLDADDIYVADLRAPQADGAYPVHRAGRTFFDAQVDHAKPPPKVEPASASVVVYKASWCGACKAAEAFLREKHVTFVEKDVEKDPGAQAEMLQKAQAKGLSPRGVPVIDFRGEIMLGFDQARLEQLIDRYAKAI